MTVRYAIGLPTVGEFGDPALLVDLGVAAEQHGWDAVYFWEHLLHHDPTWPVANSTVVVSALAARTSRIRLGILVNHLARRRVQVLARETASLDVLSGGRLVVGAGLGSLDSEYAAFGEDPDLRVRAKRLDESLSLLTQLWTGSSVSFRGSYLTAEDVRMLPTPVQQPRIPIWCAGMWPNKAGFRRAARWDGMMPIFDHPKTSNVPVADFAAAVDFLRASRGSLAGFDVALEGTSSGRSEIEPYVEAGLTWWVGCPTPAPG
jgi:alkanesulfonate monooxygenase SsuD/methylene tetrahydromethanopterin reductase-like flavin-dependent oxidoreductase (luciferase family)